MVICGLKLTHDGGLALIDNGKLIFCYEMEKLENNDRYRTMKGLANFSYWSNILNEYGYSLADVDQIVIDGWGDHISENNCEVDYPVYKFVINEGTDHQFEIELNGYGLCVEKEDLLEGKHYSLPAQKFSYKSYWHISGHLMSGYCTSPFARRYEDAFIMIWDGGMVPQLFYMRCQEKKVETLGPIFQLLGISYSSFASNYKPFNHLSFNDLSIAGKLMAYIALGTCRPEVLKEFRRLFSLQQDKVHSMRKPNSKQLIALTSELLTEFVVYGELNDIEPTDMLTTFHVFLEQTILEQLTKAISKYPDYTKNLCFVGGCALNIKWNSNIRNSGLFKEMWVPPFPNDAGSAIGAACCEMIAKTGQLYLDWDVYKGPALKKNKSDNASWKSYDCSLQELACLFYKENKPVVFLNGRAELGPRALGNRSILAPAVDPYMKTILNKIKHRDNYRPVAPICMEEDAMKIFDPGSADPLMLYDHWVKPEWKEKIPAVCHLDGTARLQTINRNENPEIYELLKAYKELSGIPLLCNTSANYHGKGFFPDIESAMQWGEVDRIWAAGKLYVKKGS